MNLNILNKIFYEAQRLTRAVHVLHSFNECTVSDLYSFCIPRISYASVCTVHGLKAFLFSALLFFSSLTPICAQTLDAYWTLVFAGKNITQPVFNNGLIYTAGADKAINCITTNGKFLWRRNIKELPGKFISVSESGIAALVTEKGYVKFYSSQGLPLWTMKGTEKPVQPVYNTRDGRIFIVFSSKIICFTHTGTQKWSMPLPSPPKSEIAAAGAGSFIILLQDKTFLRFSLFGTVLEQGSLKKEISCAAYIPNGYILASEDGTIYRYIINKGAKPVSQTKEGGICRAAVYKNGKILYIFDSGKIMLKKMESEKAEWEINAGSAFGKEVFCTMLSNEFNIVSKGFACVVTDEGRIKWSRKVLEKDFLPVITENGLLVGVSKEILNAYRMETKFLRAAKRKTPRHSYSIARDNGFDSSLLLFTESANLKKFLDKIKTDIESGNMGSKEPFYAEMLSDILQNKNKHTYFPQEFSPFERGTAAELLGKMGSFEYRDILLSEVNSNIDSQIAGGVLRGFEALAYDPEGKTLEAINLIIRYTGGNDDSVMKAACDALAALALYGSAETAEKAVKSIFSAAAGPYSGYIKNYARQKLKNIVK